VRLDTPFAGRAPSKVSGSVVTFEFGERAKWMEHVTDAQYRAGSRTPC